MGGNGEQGTGNRKCTETFSEIKYESYIYYLLLAHSAISEYITGIILTAFIKAKLLPLNFKNRQTLNLLQTCAGKP